MVGIRRIAVALVALASLVAVGSTAEAQAPQPEVANWTQVSAGYYTTCGIRNGGHLFCWGRELRGELGNGGSNANVSVPTEVSGATADWKSVSVGSQNVCAVKTNGTLWCWGRDDFGQQGNGPITGDVIVPTQVGTATDWKTVSAGLGETVCGRRANGRIYCWGKDDNGQVGNGPGTFTPVLTPTAVGTATDWTSVSAGGYHVCGRRSTGRIYCWGDDLDGSVGDGAPGTDRSSPTQVAGNRTDWASVTTGITHTCARRNSGRLFCFGSDIDGGLGNGPASSASKYAPVEVSGAATNWSTVTAGSYITCATKTNGKLFCFGNDTYGQVGTGLADGIDNPTPIQVTGGATNWKPASMGNYHTCAVRTDGRLFCWGYNFFGELGNGSSGSNGNNPTPIEIA